MAAPLTFNADLLKARSFRLDLVGQIISGGITQSGQQQVVNATGGGLWALQLEFNRFTRPEQLDAWRRIQYGSRGGVVEVNVSICDFRQAPYGVPHSDLTPFSSGALYFSPDIVAALTAPAVQRATTVTMSVASGREPLGYFSMPYGEGRHELHFILSAERNGSNWDVSFVPPLRAAHSAGQAVTFGHPLLTVRLAQPESMSMATEYGRWGNGQASFIEAFI